MLAKAQAASANWAVKRQELSVSLRIAEDAVEATASRARCDSVRAADGIFCRRALERRRPVVLRCSQDVVLRRPKEPAERCGIVTPRGRIFPVQCRFFLRMWAKFERSCCQNRRRTRCASL